MKMKRQHNPLNLFEFEKFAEKFLSKGEYDFIAGGATDEITIERTRKIYDSITLRPRMLTDVSKVDTSTKVLGESIRFPLLLNGLKISAWLIVPPCCFVSTA